MVSGSGCSGNVLPCREVSAWRPEVLPRGCKCDGLENSTSNRSIRKLRNCGEMEIPGITQESPSLALDLALGFGAEKLRM
jgi:hypothetical protein